jgi:hypothetical protein
VGTKTWDSQTTYVLPVQGSSTTTYMFMGDRWNATNLGTSTYVWQPLEINGTSLSLPTFHASWTIDTATGRSDTGPTDTYYRVTNRNSGRVMDVVEGSTSDRAEVKQHSWQGGRNQKWEFRDTGDGYLRIVNQNSGLGDDDIGRPSLGGTPNYARAEIYSGDEALAMVR